MEHENNRKFGSFGESIAVDYLKENGYAIVEKNFRAGRLGEIDIIARENGYICFVEVKTRFSLAYGMPCESITKRKQYVIKKIALIYLSRNKMSMADVRFDVVEIIMEKINDKIQAKSINLIRNAF